MSEPKRLFFALELPAEVQRQIVHWRAASFPEDAGRPVTAANLHLTLAFLGEVSADKQRALSAMAERIRQPGFTLTLDDAGQWLRSRVVWLGTRQPPRGVLQLANMLRDARHAVAIPPPGFRWAFAVNEFVLYESSFSRGRTRYKALERYPFDKES
ncbi:RNA 2',3'-cyclic phosphodiesterase [Klebsiella grimontii]|uniref:RNA 2',3'-cyclic phosphodiesterase n=1 Tax=Klebsiella grimontii TaxID=2058152 RepID=UPI001C819EB3|nr:RNA 2',3'-cyclic phosphodiesterase [Klebsiella grimontii]MBX4825657.1 RNA 2',3'-cyclic phosphodiesterase [Klebsiella grimontii]